MNFERLGDESPTTNEKRLGDKSPTTNEKEENIGTRLKKTLESEQIDVVWQTDGKSALAQLEKHPFDLILLELQLPDISGDQVLEGIRRLDPYVEVIVYTNYQVPPLLKKLINLGVDGYINKGTDTELLETVEQVKARLAPFSEAQRSRLLEALPEGMFLEKAST